MCLGEMASALLQFILSKPKKKNQTIHSNNHQSEITLHLMVLATNITVYSNIASNWRRFNLSMKFPSRTEPP